MDWTNAVEVDGNFYAADLTQLELEIEREERLRQKASGFYPSAELGVPIEPPNLEAEMARKLEKVLKAEQELSRKEQAEQLARCAAEVASLKSEREKFREAQAKRLAGYAAEDDERARIKKKRVDAASAWLTSQR